MISGTEYRRLNKPGPAIELLVPDPIINEFWPLVADDDSEKSQARLKKKSGINYEKWTIVVVTPINIWIFFL